MSTPSPFAHLDGLVSVSREIGGRTLTIETGVVGKLANAAVMLTYGGTALLATVVRSGPREGIDFFPLTVDYREKTSAAGKFPGGFKKREGPPSEKEILTMRMIDRPIRPLFPDGFIDEVQIQVFVMSHDAENDADVLAGTAAAAALAISDVPFEGPLATVRVARVHTDDGVKLAVNPTVSQIEFSDLDLVLSGHKDGMNMIEVGAAEVPEQGVLDAIEFGYEQIKIILGMIDELTKKVGKDKVAGEVSLLPSAETMESMRRLVEKDMTAARKIKGKKERSARVDELRKKILEEYYPIKKDGTYGVYAASAKEHALAKEAFKRWEEKITRRLIVEQQTRADGRGPTEIRPIKGAVGVFQRTHGSALFQRGETQSLCSVTLGTSKDEQIVDGLMPEYSKKFTLHYNFPPFSTGEVKRIAAPGRREIGHGALAERSLLAIIPSPEQFPYTIRVVSDITESNGSSSMASVCGGCLALMDAGVPIRATCAGISVGRFADDNDQNEIFVTDIIGEEDFFGDMDFKVSGTRDGITGIQLDLKTRGLKLSQIVKIFEQAKQGRHQIIGIMESIIPAPRTTISPFAPRLITINIDPEKIGKLIGPGGKMIRGLQDKWGVTIDVNDEGVVQLAAVGEEAINGAKAEIEALCEEVKVGAVYNGKVVSMKDFGAFIELAPGTDGMCHISELADGYVKSVSDVVKMGDLIKVKVIFIDDQGRIKLSRKAVIHDEMRAAGTLPPQPEGEPVEAGAGGGGQGHDGGHRDRGHGGGHGGDRGGGGRGRGGNRGGGGGDRGGGDRGGRGGGRGGDRPF